MTTFVSDVLSFAVFAIANGIVGQKANSQPVKVPFNKEEKELYDKIVRDLLNSFAERVEGLPS